jgi:hypothetical protein
MSHCSCGSAGCSCPQVTINDLPLDEQVVTTIKHEKIPDPPKKCPPPPPVGAIIITTVFASFVLKSLVDSLVSISIEPNVTIEIPEQPHAPIQPIPDDLKPKTPDPLCPKTPHSAPDTIQPNDPCYRPLDYHPVAN